MSEHEIRTLIGEAIIRAANALGLCALCCLPHQHTHLCRDVAPDHVALQRIERAKARRR